MMAFSHAMPMPEWLPACARADRSLAIFTAKPCHIIARWRGGGPAGAALVTWRQSAQGLRHLPPAAPRAREDESTTKRTSSVAPPVGQYIAAANPGLLPQWTCTQPCTHPPRPQYKQLCVTFSVAPGYPLLATETWDRTCASAAGDSYACAGQRVALWAGRQRPRDLARFGGRVH